MALITCKECGRDHSDTIVSCPHCGFKRDSEVKKPKPKPKKKGFGCGSIFLIGLVLLIIYVAFITDWSGSSSYNSSSSSTSVPDPPVYTAKDYRYVHKSVNLRDGAGTEYDIKATLNPGSRVALLDTNNVWNKVMTADGIEGYVFKDLLKTDGLPDVQIIDWSWTIDPDFGTDGSIIWIVNLRNNTNQYIKSVRVEISIFDGNKNLTETDFMYVQGLSPGGQGSSKGYATYYGTEKTANLRIVDY